MGLFLSIDVLLFNLRPSRKNPLGRRLPDVSYVLIFKLFTCKKFFFKLTIILICIWNNTLEPNPL